MFFQETEKYGRVAQKVNLNDKISVHFRYTQNGFHTLYQ